MNNLELFELSLVNSKIKIDFSEPNGFQVIPNNSNETNDLIKANNMLLEYITTYKNVKDSKEVSIEYKNELIYKIINILDNTNYINYSSFCIYFQVLKYSYNSYINSNLSKEEKMNLIKKIVELYIENRHDLYISHGYSNMSLQVLSDSYSSRRSSQIGTNNLKNIMNLYNFKFVNNYDDFIKENTYFFPENNVLLLEEILDKNNIDFIERRKRENKNPDLMFKINDQFYILEHKLATGAGGAQNMEVNEIISFIGEVESNKNVHYISCLESDNLSKYLYSNIDPKAKTQYNNIVYNLKNNKNNYFLNEFGLIELLKNIFNS